MEFASFVLKEARAYAQIEDEVKYDVLTSDQERQPVPGWEARGERWRHSGIFINSTWYQTVWWQVGAGANASYVFI